MFKKAIEAVSGTAERVRKVITEFTCTGFGSCALEDIVIVSPGLSMPPILELCSKEHTGAIPHNANVIRYDETAHAAYLRDNAVRPEPPATVWWTEDDIKKEQGWSDSQFAAAKASGFPQPNGHRPTFDRDGVPTGRINLWSPEIYRNWVKQVHGLVVTGQ